MPGELTDLIPEFNEIQDEDLRTRVLAVWLEAMEVGEWSIAELQEMPYTLLIEDVEISFPQHVSVVCRLCMAMPKPFRPGSKAGRRRSGDLRYYGSCSWFSSARFRRWRRASRFRFLPARTLLTESRVCRPQPRPPCRSLCLTRARRASSIFLRRCNFLTTPSCFSFPCFFP